MSHVNTSTSSSAASQSAASGGDDVKTVQAQMIKDKKTYRRIEFDQSRAKVREGIEMNTHRLDEEDKIVVKVKGVFPASLDRCYKDFCNDAFVQARDGTILDSNRTAATITTPCADMHTKNVQIKSFVPKMTHDKHFELHTCVWQNAKDEDNKEILSQTTPTLRARAYNRKAYLPVYDVFTQFKLEKLSDAATKFLFIAVWHIPEYQPSLYEKQLGEGLQTRYVRFMEAYKGQGSK